MVSRVGVKSATNTELGLECSPRSTFWATVVGGRVGFCMQSKQPTKRKEEGKAAIARTPDVFLSLCLR